MRPIRPIDLNEFGEDEEATGRGQSRPEMVHRTPARQRVKARARRSRSNDVAKRGMHQRRNKRTAW